MKSFIKIYPKLISFLVMLSDSILILVRTLIVTIGVPITLVFIMFVETERVAHGIEIFEANANMASLASWVLIILNMVLEFLIVYKEHSSGYSQPTKYRWSLKMFFKNLVYRFGFHKENEERSPAYAFEFVLFAVTFGILFLALLGSMKGELERYDTTWHQTLLSILTQSTLIELLTWTSGLIFAFTLVISAQGLSNYVAYHTTAVLESMINIKQSMEREEKELLEKEDKLTPKEVEEGIFKIGEEFHTKCPTCGGHRKVFDNMVSAKNSLRSHKASHTASKNSEE